MSNVFSTVDVPWTKLQPWLVQLEDKVTINFTKFLERYKIKINRYSNHLYMIDVLIYTSDFGDRWQESVVEAICTSIYERSGM